MSIVLALELIECLGQILTLGCDELIVFVKKWGKYLYRKQSIFLKFYKYRKGIDNYHLFSFILLSKVVLILHFMIIQLK